MVRRWHDPVTLAEIIEILSERAGHLEVTRGRGPVGKRLRELAALRIVLMWLKSGAAADLFPRRDP